MARLQNSLPPGHEKLTTKLSDSLFCFVIFFDIFSVCLHRHCFASASKCQQMHPYTVYSLAKSPPPGELTWLPGGERGAARTGHSMHNCDQGAGL